MLHRLFTGLILGVALWYAMSFLPVGREVAIMVALLPVLAALLNLLTGFVFALSALVAIPVIFYALAGNEPWFREATNAVRHFADRQVVERP